MHEVQRMRPIATDVARSVVRLSVCQCVCWPRGCGLYNAKAAKPTEMPFQGLTSMGTMKYDRGVGSK